MINFIKNHPVIAILLLLTIGPASLNYSGFCISQGRYLSDKEKIGILADSINRLDQIPVEVPGYGTKHYKQIKYKNSKELLEKNPNCCRFDITKAAEPGPPSFWNRIYGNYNDVITYKFTLWYLDEDNNKRSEILQSVSYTNNCGQPVKI